MFRTISLLVLEILPIFVFFGVGQYVPFLQAVAIYILTTTIVIGVIWHLQKRVSYLALIFGGVIIVSGSLSIWFANPDILLLSDTLYYMGASAIMVVLSSRNINLIRILFSQTFTITDLGWRILNQRWIIALAICGISNELVRQLGTTDEWLVFQVVRTLLLIAFATYQFTLTKRHRLPTASSWGLYVSK